MPTPDILNNFQSYAQSLLVKHDIPAISLAIWHNNTLHQAAAGTLNIETNVDATSDSIFQVASISKVFTTCLVMQLVDAGRVDLDQAVNTYLRDFRVADADASASITVRQLLTHTNGLMGDFFPNDIAAEGNPIARYVDRCNLLSQVHAPGEHYSYSNTAFVIAGRLVEVMLAMTWFDAVEERIFKPLGMTQSLVRSTELLRFRAAMGHIAVSTDGEQGHAGWQCSPEAYMPAGLAPAGSALTMSASDLIVFAKAHLNGGLSDSGERWLSAESVAEMQSPQFQLPVNSRVAEEYSGIGWSRTVFKKKRLVLIGHDGASFGHQSMLKICPQQKLAFSVLLNIRKGGVLKAIYAELMEALLGIDCNEPPPVIQAHTQEDLARFEGRYASCPECYYDVLVDGEGLVATLIDEIDKTPPANLTMSPVGEGRFATYNEQGKRIRDSVFLAGNKQSLCKEGGDSPPLYLFPAGIGGRLNKRVF